MNKEEALKFLEKEWHPTKNGDVSFFDVKSFSHKFWWLGECGHEWEARFFSRIKSAPRGCPICSGHQVLQGFNDIGSKYPLIAEELHPTKNIFPASKIYSGSAEKVWWLCEKGHEWECEPYRRTARNTQCFFCNKTKLLTGFNDIETVYPLLVSEWNYEKNFLPPNQILSNSTKKFWWLCNKGHEWEAKIPNRLIGANCLICANKIILKGFNDFESFSPDLMKEWHPTKNKDIEPDGTYYYSGKKVWWLCNKGHEWESVIKIRVKWKNKCPICSLSKPLIGVSDLSTTNPVLATEWHPTLNGEIKPENVTEKSTKKVWWLCNKGHEWEAIIFDRNKGSNCLICINHKVLPGFNDLKTTHPLITKEWHPTKNLNITPDMVTFGSNKKVWWLCEKGHEWEAKINDRNRYSCLKCSMSQNHSIAEKIILKYVKSLLPEIKSSDRTVIKPYELDIYVPEKNIAIEYNGLYWHAEKHKPKNYHYNKWLACKEKGIQLIQIWEDDWQRAPELIKTMIAHKLGMSKQEKVYARKTNIIEMTKKDAEIFLNENHIQGYASGSYYLGLENKKDKTIIAIMVLKKQLGNNGKNELNLTRYATSVNVVGGFTKLLSYVEKTYEPYRIITFADHTVSNGGLYENNGFIIEKELPPDYMYIVNGQRTHKFGYRLKRFKNDPDLKFVEGLTEKQLAELNGLNRIWDAGKTKYVKLSS